MASGRGLTLLSGPANAGKVALLLERYLGALDRDPVLIVPHGSDVERIERELLAQSGALLSGDIGTFDDVFERIARAGGSSNAGRDRCAAAADHPHGCFGHLPQRPRRVVAVHRLRGRARDRAGRARVGPRRARRSPRRPRTALHRISRGAGQARPLGPRPAAAPRRRSSRRGARRLVGPTRLCVRVRGPDRSSVGAPGSARRPHRGDRLASVRAEPGSVRVARAHVPGPQLARRRAHRGARASVRRGRAARARTPRAPPVRGRPAAGSAARRLDPVPGRSRCARHARARRGRSAEADPRRHEAGRDPRRLPERRPPARPARDRADRARSAVRDRGAHPDREDVVRPGAPLVPALRVARGRAPRPVRLPPLAVLRPDARARGLPRGAAARPGGERPRAGRRGDAQAARAAAAGARRLPGRGRPPRGRPQARPLDDPRRIRPRLAACRRGRRARPARAPCRDGAPRRARSAGSSSAARSPATSCTPPSTARRSGSPEATSREESP